MFRQTVAAAAFGVVGVLVLAACGGDNDSTGDMPGMGSSSSANPPGSEVAPDFNDADVTFATDMISHHRQAVEMAGLAEDRAASDAVKDLAARIEAAQDPEIEQMSEWLSEWGEPVPDENGGMDMSGSMPGMMSSVDMGALENASGEEFDQMFLQMMMEHHQGAIEMAQTEQSDGMDADAIALATKIEVAQTEEITTMQDLLN